MDGMTDRRDGLGVNGPPRACPVEVDDVEPPRAAPDQRTSDGLWIIREGRFALEITLCQPNHSAPSQVDRHEYVEAACQRHVAMLPY